MNKEQIEVIFARIRHEITTEQFAEKYPVEPGKEQEHVEELLLYAISTRNSRDVLAAVIMGSWFGFSESCVPLLNALLTEDWHKSHEEIVLKLQQLRDPSSVEPLYQAALLRLDYMDYDDSCVIASNCCWALGDINTAEADEKLRELMKQEDPIIAEYAREQFERDDRPPSI